MEEEKKRGSLLLAVVVLALMTLMMVASATKITVGGNQGWSPNVNYTLWAQDKHFYYDDWLFFVYDRNQQNVLEVNKTDYESCNSDHPLHNYTTGAGRDVVHLNVTRDYYFISGKGFCYSGMKLGIHVEKIPPPPALEANSSSATISPPVAAPAALAVAAFIAGFF
uniref:Phytocyanin domain-containing protein n=1 Tax=Kalanchoe fedtschenkoi TaxID=63787 RepID=A0A7N0SYV9_KALFE